MWRHPRNTNIIAIGCDDGTGRIWDVSTQVCVSSLKEHTGRITSIRFVPDCRVLLSSWDKTVSIVTLDDQFQLVSSVNLEGHTRAVCDIIPLRSSNQCVTCSSDKTMKVWDCETGACLQTLTEHRGSINALAMHPKGKYFASGSRDRTVIIWSSETFEFLRHLVFPSSVSSLMFVESDTFSVGVKTDGVMSCNALTGELGQVIIPGAGNILGLAFGEPVILSLVFTIPH
jgi:WD40 repeat protein